ncbi:hypothetical protein [Clostridium uliginosum]|uniref:Reticulocyte-binding protein n=1 Tax=Clostridium uliginosum TaxID=119641 RepID=A0A1I1Q159_9CLOT|nr:hypothetical protein SAMN05421842_12246 [Clostridium uliginosum]
MIKKIKLKDYIIILSILLVISFIVNIYIGINMINYKYRIGRESYLKIEDIKQRNESNMDVLNMSIEQGNIKNEDLLKLYKNYDVITSDVMALWEQYAAYKQNSLSLFSKKIDTKKVIENDIHGKIKEYMSVTLNEAMKNKETKLVLSDDYLNHFSTMQELSEKIYNYFEKFNSQTLPNIVGEEREKEVVKNHYWIDMLEGIYDISGDYTNVQWVVSDAKNVNNVESINDEEIARNSINIKNKKSVNTTDNVNTKENKAK